MPLDLTNYAPGTQLRLRNGAVVTLNECVDANSPVDTTYPIVCAATKEVFAKYFEPLGCLENYLKYTSDGYFLSGKREMPVDIVGLASETTLEDQLRNAKPGEQFECRNGLIVTIKEINHCFKPMHIRVHNRTEFGIEKGAADRDGVGYTFDGFWLFSQKPTEFDIVKKVTGVQETAEEKTEIVALNEPTINPIVAVEQVNSEILAELERDFKNFVFKFKATRNGLSKKDWQLAQLNAIKVLAVLTYEEREKNDHR